MAPSVEVECESFWKGYRFKSASNEQQYQDKWRVRMVQGCWCWCCCRLLLDGLGPLVPVIKYGGIPDFYWVRLPCFAIATMILCLLSFVPWFRKHILPVISVGTVLMTLADIFDLSFTAPMHLDHTLLQQLPLVVARLEGDAAAVAQLRGYLEGEIVLWSVWKGMLQHFTMNFLLLAIVGVHLSTLLATLLAAVTSCGLFFVMPHIPLRPALMGSALAVCIASASLLVSRWLSYARRESFLLERFFEESLEVAISAGRKADSILNHSLKNTMADAAGDIDLFLTCLQSGEAAVGVQHLEHAAASLWRGMRNCLNRQAYLHLVAGKYSISLQRINLRKLVSELVKGRNMRSEVPDLVVLVDERLWKLILDNAISNAFKHGHPQNPNVDLTAETCPQGANKVRLTATVTNEAHPSRPAISPEYLAKVLKSEAPLGPATSAISDRIGLQHAYMAAHALGAALNLTQTGERVEFVMALDVEVSGHTDVNCIDHVDDSVLDAYPADLNICVLDDSEAARRLLYHNLISHAQTKNVHVYGENEAEVAEFTRHVLEIGDIAILDQHLEYGGDSNLLGSDIVADLLRQGFKVPRPHAVHQCP